MEILKFKVFMILIQEDVKEFHFTNDLISEMTTELDKSSIILRIINATKNDISLFNVDCSTCSKFYPIDNNILQRDTYLDFNYCGKGVDFDNIFI